MGIAVEAARNQFDSSFHMLIVLTEICDDDVWNRVQDEYPFGYQVYHVAYFVDFWIREKYDGREFLSEKFEAAPEFERVPEKEGFISRERMLSYLDKIHKKTAVFFDGLEDAQLAMPIAVDEENYTYLDVILTQNRHIMFNIGYLNGILRREEKEESYWFAYNEKDE